MKKKLNKLYPKSLSIVHGSYVFEFIRFKRAKITMMTTGMNETINRSFLKKLLFLGKTRKKIKRAHINIEGPIKVAFDQKSICLSDTHVIKMAKDQKQRPMFIRRKKKEYSSFLFFRKTVIPK